MAKYLKRYWSGILLFMTGVPFHAGLMSIGVMLRLKHFLDNHSLWVDESWTAISILGRSYREIFHQIEILPNFSKPPLGFLLIERCFADIFGNSEMALRLFPLVASIASILVFYLLLTKITSPSVTSLALAMFVFSHSLIYYSAEIKQYSGDVFFGLLLFCVFWKWQDPPSRFISSIVYGLTGAVMLWFSNACLFILVPIALVTICRLVADREWGRFKYFAVSGCMWLISFLWLYKVSLSSMVGNQDLKASWEGALLTSTITSPEGLMWARDVFSDFIRDPLGLQLPVLAAVLLVTGFIGLHRRNPLTSYVSAIPMMLVFVAAITGHYPFRGRLLLFIAPYAYLLIAKGTFELSKIFGRWRNAVGPGLVIMLLLPLSQTSWDYFLHSKPKENNRSAMKLLNEHYKKGDALFLNTAAQYPFWYYTARFGLDERFAMEFLGDVNGEVLIGHRVGQLFMRTVSIEGRSAVPFRFVFYRYGETGYLREYLAFQEISETRYIFKDVRYDFSEHDRVWVYFSRLHVPEVEAIFLKNLEQQGSLLKKYEGRRAQMYLYEIDR